MPGEISRRKLVRLFKEVIALDSGAQSGARHRGRGADGASEDDGDDITDEVSAEAFSLLCRLHGIAPSAVYEEAVHESDVRMQAFNYEYEGAVCKFPKVVEL